MIFLEVLNIVVPIFLVITLGSFIRHIGLIDQSFITQTNRLVFFICLPALLFHKIGKAEFSQHFNPSLIAGMLVCTIAIFLGAYLLAWLARFPASAKGVFAQGAFRGNLAYMGLPLVYYAYGEEGLTTAGILMGFLVPALNFFAIIALLMPQQQKQEHSLGYWVLRVFNNPLLIASFLGIAWSYFNLGFPILLDRGLDIVTGMTLPLALIAIGADFSLNQIHGDLKRIGLATGIKIILMPLLAFAILSAFHVHGTAKAVGVLFAGAPTAATSYIMADQMDGNAELAGSIVMLSTLLSSASLTILLYFLHQ